MNNGQEPERSDAERAAAEVRGQKIFSTFDQALRVVWITLGVMAVLLVVIALSGADMAALDEHPVFRYRTPVAVVLIVAIVLFDWRRRRQRQRADEAQAAREARAAQQPAFELSVDPERDRRAAIAEAEAMRIVRRDRSALFIALALLAAGSAAFWHDDQNHDIPNAAAVPANLVDGKCYGSGKAGVGPHMALGYQFVSRSTSQRSSSITCLTDQCEPGATSAPLDTEYKKVPYATLAECQAALPGVLAAKEPTTVWTGDKPPNAAIRARFTAERGERPYFLIWIPATMTVAVLLVMALSSLRRRETLP